MKKSVLIRLTAFLFILCLLFSLPVSAEEKTRALSAPDTALSAPDTADTLQIRVPFVSFAGKTTAWDFPYSDALFSLSSQDFSVDFAKATLGLTISAFQDRTGKVPLQYKTYLEGAGFRDVFSFGYEEETSKDSLAGIIGWKKVGDCIVIAASARGWGYQKEWGGNLELGTGERHQGFDHAAKILETQIDNYIRTHELSGKMKLWLGGFSRAAAVANLTAADMVDSGRFEDVYAYLYGVPRTTKAENHGEYTSIFNICGKNDPVTQVAPQEWGYHRYGCDCFTPAMEADSGYIGLAAKADAVLSQLTGSHFRCNPQINYQLHMILEFLCELFPTGEDYVEKFQDTLMTVWTEVNPDRFLTILAQAIEQVENLDYRKEKSSEILIDYLSMIMSQHLSEEQEQILEGYWDPEMGVGENLMREHLPYTYLSWVFSGIDRHRLFFGLDFTRRLCIFGEVDVAVYCDGKYIAGYERNRKYIEDPFVYDLPAGSEEPVHVFVTRNGNETVVNLPMDRDLAIRISAPKSGPLLYYDVLCSPYATFGNTHKMFVQSVLKGEYWIQCGNLPLLTPLDVVEGKVLNEAELSFTYSPTLLLANEVNTKRYIRLTDIFGIFSAAFLFFVLVLLVSLVIALIHRKKARTNGRTYSSWYIIVPHLLLTAVFALLTRFFTVSMFSIGHVRTIYAALTMLTLILLAFRAYLKRRTTTALCITVFLLLTGIADVIFYQQSSLVSGSAVHTIVYLLFVALLCVLASSGFFIGRKKEKLS